MRTTIKNLYSVELPGNGISHIGSALSERLTIRRSEFHRLNISPRNVRHRINDKKIHKDQIILDVSPVCRLKRNRKP